MFKYTHRPSLLNMKGTITVLHKQTCKYRHLNETHLNEDTTYDSGASSFIF